MDIKYISVGYFYCLKTGDFMENKIIFYMLSFIVVKSILSNKLLVYTRLFTGA